MATEAVNTGSVRAVAIHSPCAEYLLGIDIRDGRPYGVTLCDTASCETVEFSSLNESLLWMDRQMNQRQYPRADTERRSFAPDETGRRKAADEARHQAWLAGEQPYFPKRSDPAGAVPSLPRGAAVFRIQILHRRHSSWQGRIDWIRREGAKEAYFRSVLELMHLIGSALSEGAKRAAR